MILNPEVKKEDFLKGLIKVEINSGGRKFIRDTMWWKDSLGFYFSFHAGAIYASVDFICMA